ncbi:hypothetical protein F5Y05DRAFT_413571 [Hypoxylon sp. FL0543]|nr:hypothetical protein F5Y05DRAFT_413571 [Hypoxylon sp. FL0543]
MGRRNRDLGIVQPRPIRHHQAKPHRDGTPPMYPSHPPSPHTVTYTLNGTSYYPHPCSHRGKSSDEHCGSTEGSRRGRLGSRSKLEGSAKGPSISPIPTIVGKRKDVSISTELKVSIAAKHLAEQISESKKFWVTFQEKYEREVAEIRYYAGDDILQQIWRKRIEYNGKYKNGENQDDEEFSIQRMKLETCLDQINEAAKTFVQSRPRDDSYNHDPRHVALEKIRGAGRLVLDLAAKSELNSGACANLVAEASNLEKLVDSKSSDAKVLHRFDRRKSKGFVQKSEHERRIPTEPAPAEVMEGLLDPDLVIEEEQGEDRGWP